MRLIIEGGNSGSRQMALDETMMILLSKDLIPQTVRLWNFSPTTLSLGRFLSVKDWVNEEELKRYQIPLIRRFTGGGPALHDENGEITWSIAIKGKDIMKAYETIAKALIFSLKLFGLNAQFSPINDIVVNGKKVVGMAGAIRREAILVHGTFMFDTNLEFMSVIKMPKAKEIERGPAKSRVGTISSLLGEKISRKEALEKLIQGFNSIFSLEEGELTEMEKDISEELKYKYTNPEWTYLR
ncbi:lipoate--protein ligase family protein [Acidianus sulfidivorans JP7]|uniref:Lipoate--protein ligase family protein n=1 Tax=Acidianus sulfidivorans JP7 TaxID=619593 RepID=A0A2U9IJR0_9CREN|nr:biotin/lipoate A/B protein ligase family protein [Acidianus sulfidivorans]AWR96278.1 lipoate--protein ligase family protein [Acidianus sulfidivorans JP7]